MKSREERFERRLLWSMPELFLLARSHLPYRLLYKLGQLEPIQLVETSPAR